MFIPRFAPTSEWDTAAAQAVVEGAGGSVLDTNGDRLIYQKDNILNPHLSLKEISKLFTGIFFSVSFL